MQPEAIAAFVASGAAVLGVPAALIVGLRQARAAHHAAEVAARTTRHQWRDNNQRQAAVDFVLAVEEQLETIRAVRIAQEPFDLEAVKQLRRNLEKALSIVRIEGPPALADHATAVRVALNSATLDVMGAHRRDVPRMILRQAAYEGNQTAKEVLSRVGSRRRPPDFTLWEALRETGLLTRQQQSSFARRARTGSRGRSFSFGDAYVGIRSELAGFIEAVREHLDAAPAPRATACPALPALALPGAAVRPDDPSVDGSPRGGPGADRQG
ncbi:hypothetical protein OHA84_37305 (plasmid) [Streptomyces sp. NBC_00513]|uniref:hypothetical protein n=1 Tax=unclassified Streptomyces TaxID=2593676 RepID=UPI00225913C2|nr:hypothetical protein [Streptomyces sp. NBC_00424]MCX5078890.1 hypothetical protein [Streptomyces sp. NBC_00424]WUD46191.1 hypothetical protein OHA84_37305 [Streptomyces sp. NBC_00513]